jgi:hypothetical protein
MTLTALDPLAVNNFGDTSEGALAGPLALGVVALLAVATIFLWRNMNARIKRLPASFPEEPTSGPPASDGPGTQGGPEGGEGGTDGPESPGGPVEPTSPVTGPQDSK